MALFGADVMGENIVDNTKQEKQQEMLQELTALAEKMEKNMQKWHEIVNRQPTFSKQKQNEKGVVYYGAYI